MASLESKTRRAMNAIWRELENTHNVALPLHFRRTVEDDFVQDLAREGDPQEEVLHDFRELAERHASLAAQVFHAPANLRRLAPLLSPATAASPAPASPSVRRYPRPLRKRRAIFAFVAERAVAFLDLPVVGSPWFRLRIPWSLLAQEWNGLHPDDGLTPDLLRRRYYSARSQPDLRDHYQREMRDAWAAAYKSTLKSVETLKRALMEPSAMDEEQMMDLAVAQLAEADRLMSLGDFARAQLLYESLLLPNHRKHPSSPPSWDEAERWQKTVMSVPLSALIGTNLSLLAHNNVRALLPLRPPFAACPAYMRQVVRRLLSLPPPDAPGSNAAPPEMVAATHAALDRLRVPTQDFVCRLAANPSRSSR